MDSSTVHYLTPRLLDLRDKEIVGYSSEKIDEVRISKDNTQYIFTKEDSTKGQHGPDRTLAKIDQSRSSSKIDKSVRTKKLDKAEKIKEGKKSRGLR